MLLAYAVENGEEDAHIEFFYLYRIMYIWLRKGQLVNYPVVCLSVRLSVCLCKNICT